MALSRLKCLSLSLSSFIAQFAPRVPLQASSILWVIALACFFVGYAQAQLGPVNGVTSTPIPGVGHDYITDLVDTVNPADGSLSVRIKTPVPPGRGMTVPFSFDYDSAGVIQPIFNGSAVVPTANPRYLSSGGWTYGVPRLDATYNLVAAPSGSKGFCEYYTSYAFSDAAGARHMVSSAYVPSGQQQACDIYSTKQGAGDQQFVAGISGSDLLAADADGTTYSFTVTPNCYSGYMSYGVAALPTVEDRNGNVATFSLPASPNTCDGSFTLTDTLSRAAVYSSGFGSSGNTVSIAGLQQPYVLSWESTPDANAPIGIKEVQGPSCYGFDGWTGSLSVVSKIQLPNGQSFSCIRSDLWASERSGISLRRLCELLVGEQLPLRVLSVWAWRRRTGFLLST